MKKKQGRYYLGRIHKRGVLTTENVLDALRNPVRILRGKYKWTIVGIQEGVADEKRYLYGELIKYHDKGEVTVVDEESRQEQTLIAPGLIVDKSPFVFFKEFSGFAYLHVWNSIPEDVFRRRMAELICAKFNDFFVACEIDPISDMREFTAKISEMRLITQIKAKVVPPNPLFGVCWKDLKEYLQKRLTQVLEVREEGSADAGGLNTGICAAIKNILAGNDISNASPLSLVDAAILMATDGYGRGKVTGVDDNGTQIVVCTAETQKSFLFAKDPEGKQLAKEACRQHVSITIERKMRHA